MGQNKAIRFALFSMLGLTVFTVMFLGAYVFIEKLFGIPKEDLIKAQEIVEEFRKQPFTETIKERETESIITSLIVKAPSKEDESGVFVLKVMNIVSGRLVLLTLPGDTQLSISNELYVSLQNEMPTVPQILLLETVFKLAEEREACEYARRMLEDVLGISITAYTLLPEPAFWEYLSKEEDGLIRLSERVEEIMNKPIIVKGIRDLFLALYETEGFFSELSYEENSWYLEYYEGLKPSWVTAIMVQGEQKNEAFFLDIGKIREAVYEY